MLDSIHIPTFLQFLNGRIYLQTPEGLRPAKITFPGEHQEKLENIARISLKTADKAVLPMSSKKGRKSSKNESSREDVCQKQCTSKYLPLKDNEDNEKIVAAKSKNRTFKSNERKAVKRITIVEDVIVNKKIRISQCKNKREKKTEENDVLIEHDVYHDIDIQQEKIKAEFTEIETNSSMLSSVQNNSSSSEIITQDAPSTSNDTESISSKL